MTEGFVFDPPAPDEAESWEAVAPTRRREEALYLELDGWNLI